MSDEQIQFLKDNLEIEIERWGTACSEGYRVKLILRGEVISESKLTTETSN